MCFGTMGHSHARARQLLATNLVAFGAVCALATAAGAHEPHACPDGVADTPSFRAHMSHDAIAGGEVSLEEVIEHGHDLFNNVLNFCDGQGRPGATGAGAPRNPNQEPTLPLLTRVSGPDSTACVACHNRPIEGGAGDFAHNVFILAESLDPPTFSVSSEFSVERNPPSLTGIAAIEMLAREMSLEIQARVRELPPEACSDITVKGAVPFEICLNRFGNIASIDGVDPDLIIKPFQASGVTSSMRAFAVGAMNTHFGMQAEELFDLNPSNGIDLDQDGVDRELTVGDITAVVLYMASDFGVPGRVLPADPDELAAVERGEALFGEVGCASCHVPELRLDDPNFTEPGPFNGEGIFPLPVENFDLVSVDDVVPVTIDLTEGIAEPQLEKAPGGGAIVRAYTDLKRHNMCDPEDHPDPIRDLCNETLAHARPDQRGRPGREFFITRRLWDVGSSAPYGHRGDLTSIIEAIDVHAGEARAARDAFFGRPIEDQRDVVRFLKTLRILPAGSPRVVIEDEAPPSGGADVSSDGGAGGDQG